MSLSLVAAAAEHPERVALIAGGVSHTFADLAPRVRRVVGWLAEQGIDRQGARTVALVADNRIDTLLALYALWELGAPVAVVHPRLTARERGVLLAAATPALVLDESWREGEAADCREAPPAPPPADDDRCLTIVFTSGTTGRSKGALLGRAAFVASALASAGNLGWQEEDRWLLCMPLAHVGGLSIVSRCLLARRTVVLAEPGAGGRFEPAAVLEEIQRYRVTLASLVPTMLRGLLAARPGWGAPPVLRAILVGGAAASAALLEEAAEREVPAVATYGMTEACSQVTCQRYGTRPGAQHGAGAPLAGVELRIVDDEVQVRGPMLMSGYLGQDPQAHPFLDGGWFATGDFGALDGEGRLHLLARRSDLIVTGGENVYPVEIELLLEGLAGVAGACVFGIPDDRWGQRVAIALVPSPGGPPVDRDLVDFFRANLAPHKRPREVAVLDSLPATPAGKIDRVEAARLATPRLRPLRES